MQQLRDNAAAKGIIKRVRKQARLLQQAGAIAEPGKMLPLDYMLMVINDPNATQARRDQMAIQAAPYCHAKLSTRLTDAEPKGKKEHQAELAKMAGVGTEWAQDLEFENRVS